MMMQKRDSTDGSMGVSLVAKDGSLPAHSVAVFGQPSLLWPKLTRIALVTVLEDCPTRVLRLVRTSTSSPTASAP